MPATTSFEITIMEYAGCNSILERLLAIKLISNITDLPMDELVASIGINSTNIEGFFNWNNAIGNGIKEGIINNTLTDSLLVVCDTDIVQNAFTTISKFVDNHSPECEEDCLYKGLGTLLAKLSECVKN
jgi:hypothetical protein